MTDDLKSIGCPICGRRPSIQSDGEGSYKVKCDQLDHRVISFGMSKAEAIIIWNRRHVEPTDTSDGESRCNVNSDSLPEWLKDKLNEKIMPGSRPLNYETKIIMNTLEWVLSLRREDAE